MSIYQGTKDKTDCQVIRNLKVEKDGENTRGYAHLLYEEYFRPKNCATNKECINENFYVDYQQKNKKLGVKESEYESYPVEYIPEPYDSINNVSINHSFIEFYQSRKNQQDRLGWTKGLAEDGSHGDNLIAIAFLHLIGARHAVPL